MWKSVVFLAAMIGMAQGEYIRPGEIPSTVQTLEDQQSRHAYRVRWRMRGWNSWQTYGRIEWERQGQRLFFLHERDAGERWGDFSTLHYARRGKWGEIVIGDLRPKSGGGMLWGRGRHKLTTTQWSLRDSREMGYRSSSENGIVRGSAWRHQVREWKWMIAGGRAHYDARLAAEGHVVSLPKSGLHRTHTERAGHRLLHADVGGGSMVRLFAAGQLGISVQFMQFSHRLDLRRRGRTPWDFTGSRQVLWSIHGSKKIRSGSWSTEMGLDADGHWAGIAQGVFRYRQRIVRLLGRFYAPGFYAPFSSMPSAAGGLNELGIALVVEGRQGRVYADIYRRPARTYYVPIPSNYVDWGADSQWRIRSWHMHLACRGNLRPRWENGHIAIERRIRIRADWTRRAWAVQVQALRWNQARHQDEWGRLVALRWRRQVSRVRWIAHLSTFWTDSYRSRLYEYEHDLPGTVSFRPLYNRGARAYILIGIRWRRIELSLRYRLQRDRQWRHHAGSFIQWTSD